MCYKFKYFDRNRKTTSVKFSSYFLFVIDLIWGVLGLELGDGVFHELDGVGDIDIEGQALKLSHHVPDGAVVVLADLGDEDALVGSVCA